MSESTILEKLFMIGTGTSFIFSTIICLLVALVIWFPKIYYTYVNNRFLRIIIPIIALISCGFMGLWSFTMIKQMVSPEQYSPLYGTSNNPLYRDGMSYTSSGNNYLRILDTNEKYSHLYGRHDSPMYRDSTSSVQSNNEYSNL